MKRLLLPALFTTFLSVNTQAHADCDATIITALDVSSSINAQETVLQIDGVAEAITSPAVVGAIVNGKHGCINFQVFLWADGEYPALVDWTVISSQEDAEAVAGTIRAALDGIAKGMKDASKRNWGTLTNLSGAIDHANELLDTAPPAERILVNIAGNGEDNVGEDPTRARAALIARGVTINGVVIGGDKEVLAYYRTQVVGGEYARTWAANSTAEVAGTFALKFMAEIAQVTTP
jgi:hypothetical protein